MAPGWHEEQMPLTHVLPAAHLFVQLPQCASSVWKFTQPTPEQNVSPGWQ